jgi:membrane protein
VGTLSAVTLAWSATSGFIAVQQAMDVIWESKAQRSYVVRRLIGFVMLVILLMITVGSAIIMAVYPAIHLSPLHRALAPLLAVIHVASRVVFPVSLFFGFLVFYRYLPKHSAPWVYLLPGAFVAAVLLDLARALFVWYATHLGSYEVIYGSLTAVMLLVIWMYIASIVMLFGAEVAAALEYVLEGNPRTS